jgi:hypothetical protein
LRIFHEALTNLSYNKEQEWWTLHNYNVL